MHWSGGYFLVIQLDNKIRCIFFNFNIISFYCFIRDMSNIKIFIMF